MSVKKIKEQSESSQGDEDVYQVECIRDKRIRKGILQYKIKWHGYSEKECTWENVDNIIDKDMIETFEIERQTNKKGKRNSNVDRKENEEPKPKKTKENEDTKLKNTKNHEEQEHMAETHNDVVEDIPLLKNTPLIQKDEDDSMLDRVTTIDNYNEFAKSIESVECVFKNENNELMGLVRFKNSKQGTVLVSQLKTLAPILLIDYYETKLVFSESRDEGK